MARKPWSDEERARLADLYPSHPTKRVAQELNRDISGVYKMATNLGLKKTEAFLASPESGRLHKGQTRPGTERGQFKKGHVPHNTGLRRPGWAPGRMKETQFKKGCRSGMAETNWVPIGTIKPDSEGYLRIKVREAQYGKEPSGFGNTRVWPLYHRHVWEQANGPIPSKHLIVFRDGNRSNVALDNLELISMRENAARNCMWNNLPRELAEAIQLQSVLKRKLRKMHGEKQDQ